MKKIAVIIISLVSFSIQAIAAPSDEEKYIFEDLEEVRSFFNWQVGGWQVIDSRSLIVTVSPSESYLLILERNLWAIKYTDQIRISSAGSRVRSNIDRVFVDNQPSRPIRIDAIYLLPDRATRNSIRERITGEKPETTLITASGEVI